MKRTGETLKGFVLGIIAATVVCVSMDVSAAAVRKQIDAVYNNIKVVVDGRTVNFDDEPFLYNGRVYMPLRATADAITGGTKPVEWDSQSQTVYIGGRPTNSKVGLHELKAYQGADARTDYKFEVRQQEITPFNAITDYGSTYLLEGKYSTLTALFAVGDSKEGGISSVGFYNPDDGGSYKYDKSNLIAEFENKQGQPAIPITLDVVGLDKLVIYNRDASSGRGVLYNIELETIPGY